MQVSREVFRDNWKRCVIDTSESNHIIDFINGISQNVLESLRAQPNDEMNIYDDLTGRGILSNYNATFGQNDEDYQYSYEEGYFDALEFIIAGSSIDSDSMVMPAIFVARHYIELSLKDVIFNLKIATGTPFDIGNNSNHQLSILSDTLKEILETNNVNILDDKFFEIIKAIESITPKSDEFRYTFNVSGKYNQPIEISDKKNNSKDDCNKKANKKANKKEVDAINLVTLGQLINYIHLYLSNLQFIISDNGGSIFSETLFENPYIKEIIYEMLHSKVSKQLKKISSSNDSLKMQNTINKIIDDSSIKENNRSFFDLRVFKKRDKKYSIKTHQEKLFDIYLENETWKLKTDPLIS